MTTLDKVRRLEKYIASENVTVDPLVETTIDKLLQRESTRLCALRQRLAQQCEQFEAEYALSSSDFYLRYERGELGDEIDFVEWAATINMLANVEQQLILLDAEVAQ